MKGRKSDYNRLGCICFGFRACSLMMTHCTGSGEKKDMRQQNGRRKKNCKHKSKSHISSIIVCSSIARPTKNNVIVEIILVVRFISQLSGTTTYCLRIHCCPAGCDKRCFISHAVTLQCIFAFYLVFTLCSLLA